MRLHSIKSTALAFGLAIGGVFTSSATVSAQDITLKLHQFLPSRANVPTDILSVWADKIEAGSNGRIKIDLYPSMQLGGKAPELFDQVVDGVTDIAWVIPGYTPGRFPQTEVFELPFMMTNAEATSRALWDMFERRMANEDFEDVHVIGIWVHGPGVIHSSTPVRTVGDIAGMKVRGASRAVNLLLKELGAVPVGMPVPAVPEALSKGVINATTIPWEVAGTLKVPELVSNHTEFSGKALYTITLALVMNKAVYEGLPNDLRAVIDENSGMEFSAFAGKAQAGRGPENRDAALNAGNNVITLSSEESALWVEASNGVYETWINSMDASGYDGKALILEASELIDKYTDQQAQ